MVFELTGFGGLCCGGDFGFVVGCGGYFGCCWWLLWFLVVVCLFLVDFSFSSLTFLKPLLFVQAKQLPKVWGNYVMTEQWPLFGNYFDTHKLKSIFNVFLNFNCKLTMLLFNGMHGLEVR